MTLFVIVGCLCCFCGRLFFGIVEVMISLSCSKTNPLLAAACPLLVEAGNVVFSQFQFWPSAFGDAVNGQAASEAPEGRFLKLLLLRPWMRCCFRRFFAWS